MKITSTMSVVDCYSSIESETDINLVREKGAVFVEEKYYLDFIFRMKCVNYNI